MRALSQGRKHQQAARWTEAEACFVEAIAELPAHADARFRLALVLQAQDRHREANTQLERALELAPEHPVFHYHRGLSLDALRNDVAALQALDRAIALKPALTAAHRARGQLLRRLGRLEEALQSHAQALELRPDSTPAWIELADTQMEAGLFAAALSTFEQAVARSPRQLELLHNLAHAHLQCGSLDRAEELLTQLLAEAPDHHGARVDLGVLLQRRGNLERAISELEVAVRTAPRDAAARWRLGEALLLHGDWARGFELHEQRLKLPSVVPTLPERPRWRGEQIEGGELVVHAERGFAPTLQAVRHAPLLRANCPGVKLTLVSPAPLCPLLSGSALFDAVVTRDEPVPPGARHVALGSLPYHLWITRNDEAASAAYLRAEPERAAHFREQLDGDATLHVGLCLKGHPHEPGDPRGVLPAELLAPLADMEGVRLYTLPGTSSEDPALPCTRLSGSDGGDPWLDTAAAISELDLVICPDSTLAHLAGALGAQTWLVLEHAADFRWGTAGSECPSYARMRLFRQSEPDAWSSLVGEIQSALKELRACPSTSQSALAS